MNAVDDFIKIIEYKCGFKEILSTSDVAKLTGLHVETIYRMRKKGEGPAFFTIGRNVKYFKKDLISWIKKTQIKYM